MRYDYSMLCLPSALPGNKGLRATVRRHIKDLRLGALGLPEFHPKMIQAYATFAVSRDATFLLAGFEPATYRVGFDCSIQLSY